MEDVEEVDNKELINKVEKFVEVNNEGHIQLSNELSEEMYEEYNLSALEDHFEELNYGVDSELIAIDKNLNVIELGSQPTLYANDYISSTTHWWGRSTIYNNSQANAAAQQFRNYALGYSTIGGLGVLVPGIGPAVAGAGGLSATYSNLVANRIDNNNNGNGVVLNMTWVAAFTVEPR